MSINRVLSIEENTKCDCSCDCSCNLDCGTHHYGIIFKNIIYIFGFVLFVLEMVVGILYYNSNIYQDVVLIYNGTVSNIISSLMMTS